jgi:Putative type VI secretion system Rhs element Vgr
MHSVQTALVVGGAGPVHTDRDHRIKVQFHWQRGSNASHRMSHNADSNAPASEQSGTWTRVSEAWAGANWATRRATRRWEQRDRPGNAPAWLPREQASGQHQAHQPTAVLAGNKSHELSSSSSGIGGYNQLVFNDSAGANRIELGTTSAQTRLQLGHLLHQTDDQRLQARGRGVDLSSAAWGAARAAERLLDGVVSATLAASDAGWSSLVARWAHNPKVASSNLAPATKFLEEERYLRPAMCGPFVWLLLRRARFTATVARPRRQTASTRCARRDRGTTCAQTAWLAPGPAGR